MKKITNGIVGLILSTVLSSGCAQKHEEYQCYRLETDNEIIRVQIESNDLSYTNTLFVEAKEYTPDPDYPETMEIKVNTKYIDDSGNDLRVDKVCDRKYSVNRDSEYHNLSSWNCHDEAEILEVAQDKFDDYLEMIKTKNEKEKAEELEKNKQIYSK